MKQLTLMFKEIQLAYFTVPRVIKSCKNWLIKKFLNKERIPEIITKKINVFYKQKIGIESAIENEQISFEKYMELLSKALSHDKVLLEYFRQTGESGKAKTVEFRIECTEKEINQEVEHVSEGGD